MILSVPSFLLTVYCLCIDTAHLFAKQLRLWCRWCPISDIGASLLAALLNPKHPLRHHDLNRRCRATSHCWIRTDHTRRYSHEVRVVIYMLHRYSDDFTTTVFYKYLSRVLWPCQSRTYTRIVSFISTCTLVQSILSHQWQAGLCIRDACDIEHDFGGQVQASDIATMKVSRK